MVTFSFEKDIARFHSAWSEWKYSVYHKDTPQHYDLAVQGFYGCGKTEFLRQFCELNKDAVPIGMSKEKRNPPISSIRTDSVSRLIVLLKTTAKRWFVYFHILSMKRSPRNSWSITSTSAAAMGAYAARSPLWCLV